MNVSIVIPAYNEEDTIGATIQAALSQDYPNFEVIVVNNASTDNTVNVVLQFPVKLVHESRKGLLWARETGRQNASGDLIANIDADCLPDPDWLSRAAKHFADPKIVAITGPYDYHDGGTILRLGSLKTQQYIYKPVSLLLQSPIIHGRAILIGGNNIIRAEVLEKANGYNTNLTFYGEDTDTAKRISKHGKVLFKNSLTMKTSARRFKSEGIINLQLKYYYHFFKHIFKS